MDRRMIDAYLARSGAESVFHVNERNETLGVVSRATVQRDRLITRSTFIFVYNSRGQLCMHRRTLHKRLYPGFWDLAAGGVVSAGETYKEGALRELEEELGVVDVPLQEHLRFFYDAPESRLWGAVFSCVWDGPIRMQPEEVLEVRWIDPASDWQRPGEQYTPDSQLALKLMLERQMQSRRQRHD